MRIILPTNVLSKVFLKALFLDLFFYIVYANDLARVVSHCKIALYADDTVLYTSNKIFDVSVADIQKDLDSIFLWCEANGIKANTDKSKVMVFGSKGTLKKTSPVVITFGNETLQTVSFYKYLGLTLDSQLNYNLHITRVINSVTDKLKQFRRMRYFLSTKAATFFFFFFLFINSSLYSVFHEPWKVETTIITRMYR